jgi:diguanylate cyclase (GGDEF)-like protein
VAANNIIGILTPYTGGFYYGAVLSGIIEAAAERGCAAVAFEMTRVRMRCSGGQMLAGRRISGWLAVNEFDDPALVQELERRGQPVVHLHSRPQNGRGCAVLPDNQGGTRAATAHLLNHGHTRIAFAGNQGQGEIGERFLGYKASLEARGITLDDSLVLHTVSNQESDGERLAHELLATPGPLPFTALVTCTDRLALGLMSVFRRANKTLPQDLAIVAFDDIDAAQFVEPALTTVKQSFRALAATATHLLLDAIQKQAILPSEVLVPTKLVVRRSCGCVATHSLMPQVSSTLLTRSDKLAAELLKLAGLRRGRATTAIDWPGARSIARNLDAAVTGTLGSMAQPSIEWWVPFLDYVRDAESLVRVMTLLESTARTWTGGDLVSNPDATGALRDLRVTLLHAWQRSERQAVKHYESVTQATYRITSALNTLHSDPARDLSWLQWSQVKHACVALWEGANTRNPMLSSSNTEPALAVVGRYSRSGESALYEGEDRLQPQDFPPVELIEVARRNKNMLTVASIPRSGDREYGVLAASYPLDYEQLDFAGSPGDWAVQIGGALEKSGAETQLRRTAELDSLTGLPNRFTLIQYIERLRALEGEQAFALLYVDVDDFKKVNDSLGHDAGDALLVQLAARLGTIIRSHAPEGAQTFMARLGGDEFVVVLLDPNAELTAIDFAEFIQQELRKPFALGEDKIFISGSIGISFGKGRSHLSQELLRDADTAMYRAKIQGRARYEVFHRDMHAQAVEKLQLDARLRQAIEQDELELWYQPILSLRTGRVTSAEALIRWRHPEQGLLGPGRFLAVAEDVGLAIPISEWVIKTACHNAAAWQVSGSQPIAVHVNVPAAHVQQPGFVEFIEAALNGAGLSPHLFGVEIVESTVMDDREVSVHALSRLLALGVHVAVDDFGTGYSNLSYLRNFPISSLKVDQSFVRTLPGRSQDSAIVKAIIAMGQGLGLSVVAEGIETPEQLQFLIQAGCDQGQGYYFAKPLDPKTAQLQLPHVRIQPDYLLPSSRRSHSPSRVPSLS